MWARLIRGAAWAWLLVLFAGLAGLIGTRAGELRRLVMRGGL